MILLVGTGNPHKLAEIRSLLDGLPVTLESVAQHGPIAEPVETGSTFIENARAKAIYYSTETGRITVGEDSGLEIDALDGAPGIYSARFNGASYPEKFEAIYTQLRGRGVHGSTARFVCALAVAEGPDILFETRATVEGRLADAPHGTGGFGYDPIFFYPPYGTTLADVTPEAKALVSHRGKAFRALRPFLEARAPGSRGA